MKIIAHRGNLTGSTFLENSPEMLDKCFKLGYDVELDVQSYDDWNGVITAYHHKSDPVFFHDLKTLEKYIDKLWIHCKNVDILEKFILNDELSKFNYFFHESDAVTVTSHKNIWMYPSKELHYGITQNFIMVLPENNFRDYKEGFILPQDEILSDKYMGICTDYPIEVEKWLSETNEK